MVRLSHTHLSLRLLHWRFRCRITASYLIRSVHHDRYRYNTAQIKRPLLVIKPWLSPARYCSLITPYLYDIFVLNKWVFFIFLGITMSFSSHEIFSIITVIYVNVMLKNFLGFKNLAEASKPLFHRIPTFPGT